MPWQRASSPADCHKDSGSLVRGGWVERNCSSCACSSVIDSEIGVACLGMISHRVGDGSTYQLALTQVMQPCRKHTFGTIVVREQAMQAKRPIPECWRSIAERSFRAPPRNETRFYSGMSVDVIRRLTENRPDLSVKGQNV
jgi:hypothetical protein